MWGAIAAGAGALVLGASVVTAIVLGRNATVRKETVEAKAEADARDLSLGLLRIEETDRHAGMPEKISNDRQVVTWSYSFGYEDREMGIPDPGSMDGRVAHVWGPRAELLSVHQRVVTQAGYQWGRLDAGAGKEKKTPAEVWGAWGSV